MGNHDKGASNYKRAKIKVEYDNYCLYPGFENNKDYARDLNYALERIQTEYSEYHIASKRVSSRYDCGEHFIFNLEDNLFDEVYEGNLYISDKIKLSHAPTPEAGYINLHGHDHAHDDGYCFAAEHINYTPVCLKTIFESGILGKTTSFRRSTVDKAIERKAKREKPSK